MRKGRSFSGEITILGKGTLRRKDMYDIFEGEYFERNQRRINDSREEIFRRKCIVEMELLCREK